MKRKNGFSLLLVLAIIFASAPVAAHAAQQKDTSPPQAAQSAPPHLNDQDQRDAQRIISGPYRLTYTVTELDGNRRVGSKRYSIVLDAGWDIPSAALRLGTKIPIETGELQGGSTSQTISYIDVGLTIDASLRSYFNGLELRSHIVQSDIDSYIDTQHAFPKEPVIRQSDFKSTILLNENKPVIIGNVDMLGTTHVLQIQVELTKLP